MEAPPAKKARAERPAYAMSRQLAKEELQATEAILLRRHVKHVLQQEATSGRGKDVVEVMEKLAANKANLKEAEEKADRRCIAPVLTSWEAPRPLPFGAPGGKDLRPEHVLCGPGCALHGGYEEERTFPVGTSSSEAAVGPFASGGLEPMSQPPCAVS